MNVSTNNATEATATITTVKENGMKLYWNSLKESYRLGQEKADVKILSRRQAKLGEGETAVVIPVRPVKGEEVGVVVHAFSMMKWCVAVVATKCERVTKGVLRVTGKLADDSYLTCKIAKVAWISAIVTLLAYLITEYSVQSILVAYCGVYGMYAALAVVSVAIAYVLYKVVV